MSTNGFDTNLAGAYVKLTAPGLHVIGEVRAAWLHAQSGGPTIVLMIEVDEIEHGGGMPPTEVGQVMVFCHSPAVGGKLVVLHDERAKRQGRTP